MSEFRIGLISEGPTDQSVIEKVIVTAFPEDRFVFSCISPTEDEIKEAKKEEGFGGGGDDKVRKKLRSKLEIAEMAGRGFDFLIIHVDGDVMMLTYDSAKIEPDSSDGHLPCYLETDRVSDNCRRLKTVVESWISEASDRKIVYCIPYINTDVWAAYMYYTSCRDLFYEELDKGSLNRILLGMRKADGRLVRRKGGEIKKITKAYQDACDRLNGELLEEMRSVFSQLDSFCGQVAPEFSERYLTP